MMPETNCAPKLAWYSSSFLSLNRCSTSFWRPNTFTIACPVKVSSICALSAPVCVHCAMKSFCDRLAIVAVIQNVSGIVTSATIASSHDVMNIITSTPTTVSSEVSS